MTTNPQLTVNLMCGNQIPREASTVHVHHKAVSVILAPDRATMCNRMDEVPCLYTVHYGYRA